MIVYFQHHDYYESRLVLVHDSNNLIYTATDVVSIAAWSWIRIRWWVPKQPSEQELRFASMLQCQMQKQTSKSLG